MSATVGHEWGWPEPVHADPLLEHIALELAWLRARLAMLDRQREAAVAVVRATERLLLATQERERAS